jgi:hypothetical protein
VFTALELDVPVSARAWATHTCTIVDGVSRTARNDFAYPTACMIRLGFAARGARPALDLFWYDGGMKPRLPREIEAHDVEMSREGILFVGDEGSILAGFRGQNPQLFAKGKREALALDEAKGGGRHDGWFDAVKGGEPSPGSFLSAEAITDAVNLGTVALRAREKVLFDSEKMEITNVPGANRYLRREYREGWEL